MSEIDIRVAGWHRQIQIQMRDLDYVPEKLIGVDLAIIVEGPTLLIGPGVSTQGAGAKLHPQSRTQMSGDWPIELEFSLKGDSVGALRHIGYFGLMELGASVDDAIQIDLPPVHRRPWPRLSRRIAMQRVDELVDELRRRIVSAQEHDEKFLCDNLIREVLRPHWAGVLRQIEAAS